MLSKVRNLLVPSHLKLYAAISIKVISATLSFLISGLLLFFYDLESLGKYALVVAGLNLGIMLATFGMPQLILRDTQNSDSKEKYNQYFQTNEALVIRAAILVSLPCILMFGLYGLPINEIAFIPPALVFLGLLRTNFSYIRRSDFRHLSEVFTLILYPVGIVLCITSFQYVSDGLNVFLAISVSALIAYVLQNLVCKRLGLWSNYLLVFKGLKRTENSVDNVKITVWNSTLSGKEFLEILFVDTLFGAEATGIYRLFIQCNSVFLLMSRALNLVNSRSYAELIQSDKTKMLSDRILAESKKILAFSGLVIVAAAICLVFLPSSFSQRFQDLKPFLPMLLTSLLPILFGPAAQLMLHAKLYNSLLTLSFVRIGLIIVTFGVSGWLSVSISWTLFSFFAISFLFQASIAAILLKKNRIFLPVARLFR